MNRFTILHADDDPNDALLVKLAVSRASINARVAHVTDGQVAKDYLLGVGQYGNRVQFPLPDVIVLDIHMPRVNGFDVLGWTQSHQQFCGLPVLMLSSSELEADKALAKQLGATDYLVKDHRFEKLALRIRQLRKTRTSEPVAK